MCSCKLVWIKSSDLNSKLFLSGFSYREISLGAFQEGQKISVKILAKYQNSSGNFISRLYNSRNSPFYCPPLKILYDLFLSEEQKNQGLSFNPSTGILSGRINDVDAFMGDSSSTKRIDSSSYFDFAKKPNPRKITFRAKAYLENNPEEFIERDFFMRVSTSWDSRRRALMIGSRKIESDFYIDGKKATNEQYFSYLQSRKWV